MNQALEPKTSSPPGESIGGEYDTALSFGLPGWGLMSILGSLPGLAVPFVITALSDLDQPIRVILMAAALVPFAALVGLTFGLVGIKRARRKTLARIGTILNISVLVACLGIVIIALTWRAGS